MPDRPPALSLSIDPQALTELVHRIVEATVSALEADREKLGDRLCYSESEASRLLGLHVHQLRDLRLSGKVAHSRIVGNRIAYSRDDLAAYLSQRRVEAGEKGGQK